MILIKPAGFAGFLYHVFVVLESLGVRYYFLSKECVYFGANRFSMAWENEFKCHLHFSFSHDIEKQIWILMRVPWCQPFFDGMGKWIQMSFTFFVFAWHWRTDLNFACCFSFSLNFEKRIWTSYFFFRFRFTLKNGYEFHFSLFVFASLWKTDLNFVFRFCIACYWKTDWSFVCHFCMNLKSGLIHQSFETPPTPSQGDDRDNEGPFTS